MTGSMGPGLYERLLTTQLQRRLNSSDLVAQIDGIDASDQPDALVRHLGPILARALATARNGEERAQLTRRILSALPDDELRDQAPLLSSGELRQLLALTNTGLESSAPHRPVTPLSSAALLTNAQGEPTLAAELRAELLSADRVDLLCAFVKWQGVRLLESQLAALRERKVPVRVITTTYLGATDPRALDALVEEFGAEVRVNYEIDRTRLHAKAWLLRRNSGFDTAYVGSSNLSHAALIDGLEWNVRLSAVATPTLLDKFRATFDSYWVGREFEDYSPNRDGHRLREALDVASGRTERRTVTVTLSGLEVRPKPYQAEMLEGLDAERTLHDRHRNLVVAATGTGKTIVAALDFRRLIYETPERDLSLLFIAHRKEILVQARRMYQEVLADPTFGEILISGEEPKRWKHVFASVLSLNARRLEQIDPTHFDVVVIDEFHHAEAASYQRILDRVTPLELLGLTATPERADGVDVRTFFDGRVASELRLWDALDQNLLCPFHYFGIFDGTDLSSMTWKRGGYEATSLAGLYTGNDARTRVILRELTNKVADPGEMRALGFCISVQHARYMAERFNAAGIPAVAIWSDTPSGERGQALSRLRDREVNIIFTVDLFNEGVDLPQVDTVLFLRPTESATVFLQQLGRGLRMAQNKTVLTALDFVGHQRKEFRFDQRYQALTGSGRQDLMRQIEHGFPFLPSGSQIVLDEVAKDIVLDNIRQQVSPRWALLVSEVRQEERPTLASYLERSGRSLPDVLRSTANRSWTALCREAGLPVPPPGPREATLLRRGRALTQVDDHVRADLYRRILAGSAQEFSPAERRLADMLFFSLFPDGGGFDSPASGLACLRDESAASSEISQIVDLVFDEARRTTYSLGDLEPGLVGVPLALHASYSREEILAGLGHASMARTPSTMREGVAWCQETNADALLITLKKSDADFSPTTMYRDYALSPDLFHWESQSTTRAGSPTGERYINHRSRGSHILLFVRETKQGALGATPYVFLGPADYVSHTGERPMAITWRLRRSMPTEVFLAARAAA